MDDNLDRELGDLVRSMMKDLDPDAPLEQRIATYGKAVSELLWKHAQDIAMLKARVDQLEAGMR
jgi:hypothetical protein